MLKFIVCIKQVPVANELPWDKKKGTLRRDLSETMMNPACKHALEAALQLKHHYGGEVIAITMGPPMAEEILREAIAMGANSGILLSDKHMAGADTFATSYTLSRAIEKKCPDYSLILCGCSSSDSETAQVGPQIAEELDIPCVAYVESIELKSNSFLIKRISDNFLEILEMDIPGLVTVNTGKFHPRYISLTGLQQAFENFEIISLNSNDLDCTKELIGAKGSYTKILNIYTSTSKKDNVVLKGSPKKIVDQLFDKYGDKISSAIRKDLKTHDHKKRAK